MSYDFLSRGLLVFTLVGTSFIQAGCGDWPRFDYAPLPEIVISEDETGGAVAQDLGVVGSVATVSGFIDATGMAASEQFVHLGLQSWYTGDVDYYAFRVRDDTGADLAVYADNGRTDIDLYLFLYSDAGGTLSELLGQSVDGMNEESFSVTALNSDELYIAVVGGREGPTTDYELTIDVL